MNPTKKLTVDLRNKSRMLTHVDSCLKESIKNNESLKKSLSELIDSNLKLESEHAAIVTALEQFCDECTERDSRVCKECVLNPWLK